VAPDRATLAATLAAPALTATASATDPTVIVPTNPGMSAPSIMIPNWIRSILAC